jgi:hypothetical protein
MMTEPTFDPDRGDYLVVCHSGANPICRRQGPMTSHQIASAVVTAIKRSWQAVGEATKTYRGVSFKGLTRLNGENVVLTLVAGEEGGRPKKKAGKQVYFLVGAEFVNIEEEV